jgi:hypothetical protein
MTIDNRTDDSWYLTLVPVPGWTIPVAVRVRKLLKLALRSFGLRCTSLAPSIANSAPLAVDPAASRPLPPPGDLDAVQGNHGISNGNPADTPMS